MLCLSQTNSVIMLKNIINLVKILSSFEFTSIEDGFRIKHRASSTALTLSGEDVFFYNKGLLWQNSSYVTLASAEPHVEHPSNIEDEKAHFQDNRAGANLYTQSKTRCARTTKGASRSTESYTQSVH